MIFSLLAIFSFHTSNRAKISFPAKNASFLADEAMATDPPDLGILTRALEVSVVAADGVAAAEPHVSESQSRRTSILDIFDGVLGALGAGTCALLTHLPVPC